MMRHTAMLMAPAVMIVLAGCSGESELQRLGSDAVAAATTDRNSVTTQRGVTLRRLATGSDYDGFRNSFISPHGRYVSLTDFSTLDLAVRDLSTGQLHRLTNAPDEVGMALRGVFSPDGRHIVYAWAHGPGLQIRVIGFEPDEAGVPRAAEPTIIFHNAELLPIPFDQSPDGRHILANIETPGNTNQLALISTTTGAHQALKSFDWRRPLRAEFSPD
ncbi:MAG TPA: hypothetical protein VMM78_01065, partial [Thermomicrobiales bacterium]|nr:hypothetical protein [Thermomicrobiales bacterium]